MADGNHGIIIKVLNVIVFLFFFGSNLYGSLGGPSTGYYGQKETYLTPSPDTFWIWTVINVLFLGFVIFQFFPAGDKSVDIIGWRFAGIGVLQSIWIHTFAKQHYIVAFIFSIFVALLVSHVYWDLKTKHRASGWGDILFIHLPFSLLHAYLVFLVVLSAFAAFGVDKTTHKAGIATQVLVILSLVALSSTGVGYAFHSAKGDVAGSIVIAILLAGVFSHQRYPASIHWVALAALVVNLLAIVKALYFTFRSGDSVTSDPERAPLVG